MGESSFWYRPTRVVPDQRPLNGRCCSLLKIFTSHNSNIQEEKVYVTQKSGQARDRGGPQEPKSGRAAASPAQQAPPPMPAGRRYRSIAAWPAPSSNGATAARCTSASCEQCHVNSQCRRLNRDLFICRHATHTHTTV